MVNREGVQLMSCRVQQRWSTAGSMRWDSCCTFASTYSRYHNIVSYQHVDLPLYHSITAHH